MLSRNAWLWSVCTLLFSLCSIIREHVLRCCERQRGAQSVRARSWCSCRWFPVEMSWNCKLAHVAVS